MKITKTRNAKQVLLFVLSTLIVLTLACAGLTETLFISLSESRVNEILQEVASSATPDNIMVEVANVDMRDGFIRVYGSFQLETGSTVEGSCDVVISAQDGQLDAEITAVEIAGINLGDVGFDQANEAIEEAFSTATPNNVVSFESVTITEDELVIEVRVGLGQ
jgi:hypothetical protein